MTIEEVEFELDGDEVVIEQDGEDTEPIRLEIHYQDFDKDSLVVRKHENGYRVGYLVPDEDCPSPEEADGVGYIGTALRSDGGELHERFQKALGLTRSWEPMVSRDDLLYELAQELDKDGQELLRDPEGEINLDNLKLPYHRRWKELVAEHEKSGDFGDPDRVMLSVYEHGGRSYSVGDGHNFPDFMWDVSSYGAVWMPDDHLRNEEAKGLTGKKRHAKMVEWASQAVETMNSWVNGDCWGVVVQYFDLKGEPANVVGYTDSKHSWHDDEDACYGYIGSDWAEKELEDRLAWVPEKETA